MSGRMTRRGLFRRLSRSNRKAGRKLDPQFSEPRSDWYLGCEIPARWTGLALGLQKLVGTSTHVTVDGIAYIEPFPHHEPGMHSLVLLERTQHVPFEIFWNSERLQENAEKI